MARIVSFDLQVGRIVDIGKTRYRIAKVNDVGPKLRLESIVEGEPGRDITRNDLASLIVVEEAEFIDDIDDPTLTDMRETTDLAKLPVHRVIDWHAKMFLILRMMHLAGTSPKKQTANKFGVAYDKAKQELLAFHEPLGLGDFKPPSEWTIYHDLLRWRSARYNIAAIQKKGVEYSPLKKRPPFYVAAEEMIMQLGVERPELSAANIHGMVNKAAGSEGGIAGNLPPRKEAKHGHKKVA